MTSLEPTSVTAALRTLLDRVVEAAVAAGIELPERRYVTTGGAVYDCAQVTVSSNSVSMGLAGDPNIPPGYGPCAPGWTSAFELAIIRPASEAPRGRRGTVAPDVSCIEADTERASADASVLVAAVEKSAGGATGEYGVVPASIQFGEVAGGLTAVVLSVTLNLWDV